MKRFIVGLAAVGLLSALPGSPAHAQGGNDYYVTGLNSVITGPTPFTVNVVGSDPVCAMTYNQTRLTSAPWDFTYVPNLPSRYMQGGQDVAIEYCGSIEEDSLYVHATPAFQFRGKIVAEGQRQKSDVVNMTGEDAVLTVVNKKGAVALQETIPAYGTYSFALPDAGSNTAQFIATAVTSSGMSMSSLYTKANGWAMLLEAETVPVCSRVTWAYDSSREPAGAKRFKKDIETSLKMLARETGLTFVETKDFARAQLRYNWGKIASAGVGSTDGSITFSEESYWPRDKYAGFKPFSPSRKNGVHYVSGPAGRGWLIVHETMHSLGFDHVDDEKSIMAPVNRGQGKFTKGDLAGLHAVYRSQCTV